MAARILASTALMTIAAQASAAQYNDTHPRHGDPGHGHILSGGSGNDLGEILLPSSDDDYEGPYEGPYEAPYEEDRGRGKSEHPKIQT